ncbi:MAG: TatD family hydrolase [Nanoarchaeota archaeon]
MNFIDIHCHLERYENFEKIIENARTRDVKIILAQGINVETNRIVLKLAEKYPEVKVCLGIYPIDALKMSDKEINSEIEFIRKNKNKIAGIGEVGIDFKEDLNEHERQKKVFRKFVQLSMDLDIPIIVHSRKAEKEGIEILEEMKAEKVIMHCFCGNRKLEERIIKNGWYLTIPTSVTRSQQFQERAKNCPIEQLFCETDSPFLHPDKIGENEPANVMRAYEKIAEIRGMKLEEVKKKIWENFEKLFSS